MKIPRRRQECWRCGSKFWTFGSYMRHILSRHAGGWDDVEPFYGEHEYNPNLSYYDVVGKPD